MKIGNYDVPDVRLFPTSVETLGEVYKVKKRERVSSKDLAILLGFKYGTEPHYYRKIHALQEYGLIDGKGIFQISELGEKVLHPRDDQEKSIAITKSVLSVPLWKEIYQKHGKKPREGNFWAVLVDITKVDPATAKSNAVKILGWYEADIGHISDNVVGQEISSTPSTETLRSSNTQVNQMSQQMMSPTLEHLKKITFGDNDIAIFLPENNIEEAWKLAQEYMKLYLTQHKALKHKTLGLIPLEEQSQE